MSGRRRRIGVRIAAAAAAILLAEVLAAAALSVLDGALATYGRLAALRHAAQRSASAPEARGAPAAEGPAATEGERTAELLADQLLERVLHPFQGYVFNPAINRDPSRRPGAIKVSPDGFYEGPDPEGSGGRDLNVGVFGGSFAFLTAFQARDALAGGLERLPKLRGRRIRVRCYALGGYKQPQQLGALAYLLATGRQLDAVVNLDGFNEVALTWSESLNRGLHPTYPRHWVEMTRAALDRSEQILLGRVAFADERRVATALQFDRPLLRHSFTLALVWRVFDQQLERGQATARAELERYVPPRRSFRTHGPPRAARDKEQALAELVDVWARASVAMADLCRGRGIPYLHFLQPNQYVPGSKRMSAEERLQAFDAEHPYRAGVEIGYPLLRAAGARLAADGVEFHDLTMIFTDDARVLYTDQCCHLGPAGSEAVAARIGRELAKQFARRARSLAGPP